MTAAELIRKYNLQLVGSDQIAVPGGKRLPAAVIAELKSGAPAWVREASGWIDEYGWGLIGPENTR